MIRAEGTVLAPPRAPSRDRTAPFRVVFVGMGRHGLYTSSYLVSNSNRWILLAAVDPSAAAFARFQSKFHDSEIPCYKTIAEAEEIDQADLIFVATTAPYHLSSVRELLARGFAKSILVEKPLSNSLSEATCLQQDLHREGWHGRIGVDMNRRCGPVYQPLREAVRTGHLGALKHIQYNNRCKVSNTGSHFIDMALWLIESPPVSLTAKLADFSPVDFRGAAYFDPQGCIDVQFGNDMTFQLDATGSSENFESGLTAIFEQGQLNVDAKEQRTRIRPRGKEWQELIYDPGPRYGWIENVCLAMVAPDSPGIPCPLEEAITGVEILTAAHQSSRSGGKILPLPLAPEYRTLDLKVY